MATTATTSATGIRAATAGAPLARLHEQVRERLSGPGGLYNAGNAIGLLAGVALQASSSQGADLGVQGVAHAAVDYLAGNTAALALTAATVVFFWGGDAYHRAWAKGAPPDPALNRRGDLLSALGALILGVALLSLGQVWLAATAGLLHAVGKFGSAYRWRPLPGWRSDWPDFYRSVVLASRVPAILAAAIDLAGSAARPDATWTDLVTPLTLLVCYALWSSADLMLFRAKRATSQPA